MVQKELPQAWWFDSHNQARPSSWLSHTLSELDDKTKQMLKLIDQDADSFAQRAEMYYKKRPVLVDMLGDLYRAHRSLAEQHDLLKHHGNGARHRTVFGPSSCTQSWSQAAAMGGGNNGTVKSSSSSGSLCSDSYDSESEVDDPEQEHEEEEVSEPETDKDSKQRAEQAELMRAEIEKLKEQNAELHKVVKENAALKAELAAKDEEKREVIRQLASSFDIVKQENSTLRECIKNSNDSSSSSPPPSRGAFDIMKLTKDLFSAKLFTARCKHSGPMVAL